MRILVTGAAGFIASNLIPRLLRQGHSVLGVDNFSRGKMAYLPDGHPRFQFAMLDLTEQDNVIELFRGFTPHLVWHLAAQNDSHRTEFTDFDLKGSTMVTANVLEGMRFCGAREILFASSGSVYGEPTVHPTPEDYGPLRPISLDAASKLACEGLITAYVHDYDMQAWIYRFDNIVGQNPTHGVIYDFVRRLLEDPSQLRILGDGAQSKAYVHVEDFLDGVLYGHDHAEAPVNVFNLAVEGGTSLQRIADWTLEAMGLQKRTCPLLFAGGPRDQNGGTPFVSMDNGRMRAIGWGPRLTSDQSVRRAIQEIVAQLRAQPELAAAREVLPVLVH